ncbi:hypothetical protein VQ643_15995 [Pseudomonas sp. F1_0610]|uniref:hypothetical protein n=1 Tax=Pseudomonas sp. F1_0610 TaxID=3114284 RepID=UPI0039C1455F
MKKKQKVISVLLLSSLLIIYWIYSLVHTTALIDDINKVEIPVDVRPTKGSHKIADVSLIISKYIAIGDSKEKVVKVMKEQELKRFEYSEYMQKEYQGQDVYGFKKQWRSPFPERIPVVLSAEFFFNDQDRVIKVESYYGTQVAPLF